MPETPVKPVIPQNVPEGMREAPPEEAAPAGEPPTMLLLPQQIAQALADYLATKPYSEVAHFIQILGSLRAVQGQPKPKTEPGGTTPPVKF